MSESTFLVFMRAAQLAIVLPLIVVVLKFRKFTVIHKLISLLLICSGIFGIIAILYQLNQKNNMFVSHFYTMVEYFFWSLIYLKLFEKKRIKKFIIGSIFFVFLVAIVNMIYWQPLDMYNSYSKTLESAFLVCFAIVWFYQIFINQTIKRLEIHPNFWINAAVLIYFSGSFVLFVTNNFLMEIPLVEFLEVWTLHAIFIMIHYLLLAIGLWLVKHKKELR